MGYKATYSSDDQKNPKLIPDLFVIIYSHNLQKHFMAQYKVLSRKFHLYSGQYWPIVKQPLFSQSIKFPIKSQRFFGSYLVPIFKNIPWSCSNIWQNKSFSSLSSSNLCEGSVFLVCPNATKFLQHEDNTK